MAGLTFDMMDILDELIMFSNKLLIFSDTCCRFRVF